MEFWKNRSARVAGPGVLSVRPRAGRGRMRTRGLPVMLLIVWASSGAAATAGAGQAGRLTFESCVATSGAAVGCVNLPAGADAAPWGVAVSPDGHSVYVAASDRVEHFFVASNGALSYDGCVSNDGSGGACADIPGAAAPLTGAFAVAVSPDGRSVYVASTGLNSAATVSHFFAAAQGQITWDGCVSDFGYGGACAALPTVALEGLTALAVSPSGAVYAASVEGVSHFFATSQGQLTWDGCIGYKAAGCTDVPSAAFAGPNRIAVSINGESLYVTSDGGAVSHFFVAPQGQLSWDGCVSDDGTGGFCADVPGTATPLRRAVGVAVSADGKSVDVTSFDGVVSHFFAAVHGQLSWDGCVSDDGSGGSCADIPGSGSPLAGADSLALSSDGHSAYVGASPDPGGPGSSAVSVFSVAAQGQLTYQTCLADAGADGCTGVPGSPIGGVRSIALSSDGRSLYIASPSPGSIAHFIRATASGSGGTPAPVLSSLAITPSTFKPAAGGPAVLPTRGSLAGTFVAYQLTAAARVQFVVSRAVAEGKVTKIITIGSFTQAGRAGANTFRFSGRISGARLPVGVFSLTATPASGQPVKAAFRITSAL